MSLRQELLVLKSSDNDTWTDSNFFCERLHAGLGEPHSLSKSGEVIRRNQMIRRKPVRLAFRLVLGSDFKEELPSVKEDVARFVEEAEPELVVGLEPKRKDDTRGLVAPDGGATHPSARKLPHDGH